MGRGAQSGWSLLAGSTGATVGDGARSVVTRGGAVVVSGGSVVVGAGAVVVG